MPKKNKTLIFDFDGTLADTLFFMVEGVNEFSSKYGYKQFAEKDLDYKKISMKEILRKKLKLSFFKTPFLIKDVKRYVKNNWQKIILFKGTEETLKRLNRSYNLVILSSSSKEIIENVLKKYKIFSLFTKVESSSLFGKKKYINKILKNLNLEKKEVIYIGDELRDIEACKRINIPILSVTWGFNDKSVLKEANKGNTCDTWEELIKKIN